MKVLVKTHLSESRVRVGDNRSGSESKLNDSFEMPMDGVFVELSYTSNCS